MTTITTGAATVTALGELGARFTLCQPQSKAAIGHTWRDAPHTTADALRHINANHGRNCVGVLTGHAGLVSFDCDRSGREFLARYGLRGAFVVFRRNAPERLKALVVCDDVDSLANSVTTIRSSDGGGNFLESSGVRSNVVVAGQHATGAVIEMAHGHMANMTAARIDEIVTDYRAHLTQIGAAVATETVTRPPSVCSLPTPIAFSITGRIDWRQLMHVAIEWNIARGAYRSAAERALANCKQNGQYVAIRSERTPSARAARDDFSRRTWHDYGSGDTFDEFELAVMHSDRPKRELVDEAIDCYLRSEHSTTLAALRDRLSVARQRKTERDLRDMRDCPQWARR